MHKVIWMFLALITLSSNVIAQDLLKERIWKISSRKRSIFLDKGVFHSEKNPIHQSLKAVRNSYIRSRGYERIVFDFSADKPPKIYGHISGNESKIFLDFFNTSMASKVNGLKNVKYISDLSFFNVDKNNLSVELKFQKGVSFDIFYLENPARLVIDVKK